VRGEGGGGGFFLVLEESESLIIIGIWGWKQTTKQKAYALLQGIYLAKQRKIQNLNVVGDSKTIIRIMILGSSPHNMSLKILIDIICLLVGSMHINYFHVLRINNAEADKMANKAIGKAPRLMGVDGHESIAPLP
jgi:ribonuclease HI